MNWYKRHLGDLAAACAHLSQGAMGAYDLLMDWCYANERPLPKCRQDLYRIGRASTRVERENVDRVVADFFVEGTDGYTQKRIQEEMARYQRQCEINREIGRRGGRPRQSQQTESVTESVTEATANRNPSQNPESRSTPDRSHTSESLPVASRPVGVGTTVGHAAAQLIKAGLRITSQDPSLIEACAEGVTVEALLEVRSLYPNKPAPYVIATARRIRAEGASPIPTSKDRVTSLARPRVTDDFRDVTYAGTRIDDLPPHLRSAAERAVTSG